MAPFRIRRPAHKSAAGPSGDDQLRSYLDRLTKMIPGEILSLYLVGSGLIPAAESRWWLVGWSAVCLAGLVVIRTYGTADRPNGLGPQWPAVLISVGAYIVWLYSLGGPFQAFGIHKPFLGSLLVLCFTFFAPYAYKGD